MTWNGTYAYLLFAYIHSDVLLASDLVPCWFCFQPWLLPPSIQTLRVSNAQEYFIAEDDFSKLHGLKSIHLSDVRTLRIARNNWRRIAQSEQVRITIERVSHLALHSGAFSGWPDPGPKITISNVTSCFISRDAFGPDSAIQRIVLQNIGNLTLNSSAFRANVGHLELVNISLATPCRSGSFRGRVGGFLLRSVRISDVHSGCLHAGDGWGSLVVRSSHLENIHPFGFNGRVNHVVIVDSHLGHIAAQGLHLSTTTFTLISSEIGELTSDALNVHFNQSASLQASFINSLRAHAFRRLEALAGDAVTLTIQGVTVGEAEDGSLTFTGQMHITMSYVVLREPCDCSVDERALRLAVGDATPRTAVEEQWRSAQQIINQVRCMVGADTPTLAEFHCQSCSARHEDTAPCSPMARRAVVKDWFLPVGIGTPLLALVLVGAVIIFLVRRRRRRQRAQRPKDVQLCKNCMTKYSVTPEAEYSEIHERNQRDERPASPTVRSSSSSDRACPRAGTLQSELKYSEVDVQALPRPPSSIYFDVIPRLPTGFSNRPRTGQSAKYHPSSKTLAPSQTCHPQSEPEYSEILPRPPSSVGPEVTSRV